jgi:phosphonate transport system permease protein
LSARFAPIETPPHVRAAQRRALAFLVAAAALVAASFASLDLQWSAFLAPDALGAMGRFVGELLRPDLHAAFLARIVREGGQTFAMSLVGTALAALGGLVLAVPASRAGGGVRVATRWLLNVLRSIPELAWATLLLIAAGLGPFAGTLALAFHTTGVLGRLFAEAIENAPPGPAFALRAAGAGGLRTFLYATLPQVLPQLMSYTLYRWENNIRAAAILGVVGAGGLGQMLAFHLGLFQMAKASTVIVAMLVLVLLVDAGSAILRRHLTR